MSPRMLGKLNKSQCGCCDQRAGTGKGKAGWKRRTRRQERQTLRECGYDI